MKAQFASGFSAVERCSMPDKELDGRVPKRLKDVTTFD